MKDRALASCLAGVLLVCGAADAADAGELCLVDNPTSGGFVDFGLLGEEVIDIGFDGAATLPLPGFPGNYVFQGPVIVGQDGGVAFGTSAPVGLCAENEPIPSSCAFDGEQAALVFWDDIDDKDSDVEYVLFEGPGNTGASLIIQWTYRRFEGSESTLEFQLQLFPNADSQGIYAQYAYKIEGPDSGAGASATIGYQDGPAGFGDIQYSFDQPDAVSDGTLLSLLIPKSADVDQDGTVDVSDVLMLFITWGPCGNCRSCPTDLDFDCKVGASDLALLFDRWTHGP